MNEPSSGSEEPVAWQWRYIGEHFWKTPSGGERLTDAQLKNELPIEQRPLYSHPVQEARNPLKAIEFLEWLIGFTGAVRTHPLNAYGNKILRDKVEKVGAELGIYPTTVQPSSSGSGELLALADEYEAGLKKMVASGYEEFGPDVKRKHQLTIDALRFQARAPAQCAREWRCFHCDETFTDPKAAANHFGVDHVGGETLCQMAQVDGGIARVIADLSEELQQYRSEDNTSYREFYALGTDHRAALIKEEQKGYDRGVGDARAEASSLTSAEGK